MEQIEISLLVCNHAQVGQVFLSASMADRGIVRKHFLIKAYFCHVCFVYLDSKFQISADIFHLLKRWQSRIPNPNTAAFKHFFDSEDNWNG